MPGHSWSPVPSCCETSFPASVLMPRQACNQALVHELIRRVKNRSYLFVGVSCREIKKEFIY